MKRIAALVLAALLVCGTLGISVFAEYTPGKLADAINAMGEILVSNTKVETDVQVKSVTGNTYEDGPIEVYRTAKGRDFDFKAILDMAAVNQKFNGARTAFGLRVKKSMENQGITQENPYYDVLYNQSMATFDEAFPHLIITGSFDIVVHYPEGITIPTYESCALTADKDIFDFNLEEDMVDDTAARTVTVHVRVKDGVTAQTFEDNEKLTIEFIAEGVHAVDVGTYTLRGAMTGQTTIKDGDIGIADINYVAVQDDSDPDGDLSATVKIKKVTGGGGGGGGGSSTSPAEDTVTISFDLGRGAKGSISDVKGAGSATVDLSTLDTSKVSKTGFVLIGWYEDAALTKPISGKVTATADKTLYAKWVKADKLTLSGEHAAYIMGYPDGSVRPNGNLTREEVATIFYRLLTDESRAAIKTTKNTFVDMEDDRWSNTAVSTMARGDYVKGYEDNTFKPSQAITRAEFVTITVRFMEMDIEGADGNDFVDTKNHWAEQYINVAVAAQLISGYADGSFKPDAAISRAEAITILNKLLVRSVNGEGLVDDYIDYNDIKEGEWYYYDIIEATNGHTFTRKEGELNESWNKLVPLDLLNL